MHILHKCNQDLCNSFTEMVVIYMIFNTDKVTNKNSEIKTRKELIKTKKHSNSYGLLYTYNNTRALLNK